jgi:catechol 2,3-dioxygenase
MEKGIIWFGSPLPAEFFLYGTPHAEVAAAAQAVAGS